MMTCNRGLWECLVRTTQRRELRVVFSRSTAALASLHIGHSGSAWAVAAVVVAAENGGGFEDGDEMGVWAYGWCGEGQTAAALGGMACSHPGACGRVSSFRSVSPVANNSRCHYNRRAPCPHSTHTANGRVAPATPPPTLLPNLHTFTPCSEYTSVVFSSRALAALAAHRT
ncbi:hypothetical protein M011DRAFT_119147 [Sporormia fimetaria CBS 119925]|uniref:Uncharacterized protein n=1 Tax=Sporormia fimetaria CBS 119925 TaxID=1340428 RepID=A0A6A6VP79_9PLEO|nr:hypothetical protein M011DRAFT_119147 [Sporormia fimetaria CBS 119925]